MAINYNEIYEQLMQLSFCVYAPSNYIFPSKLQKYKELTQTGREQGIRRLMSINLLKRLESSVHSFQLTLTRIKELINGTIQSINQFEAYGRADLDMYDGISIMDLGLNEFRLDLLDYIKRNGDMDKKPCGLHAVVPTTDELPDGVIFVLKNINNSVNVDNRNRIHPFYMVYIGVDGQIICDYLNPKKMLDDFELICFLVVK